MHEKGAQLEFDTPDFKKRILQRGDWNACKICGRALKNRKWRKIGVGPTCWERIKYHADVVGRGSGNKGARKQS